MPPSFLGLCRCFRLIGSDFFLFQIKLYVSLVSVLSTDLGIPWALVRNWIMEPTVISMISCLILRVGLFTFHWSRECLILSSIGF